jgi:hypothetical protein
VSDAESQLIQELRTLAGVADGGSFEVSHDGVRIRVEYTGGSSSSVALKVAYDAVASDVRASAGYRGQPGLAAIRPMRISLRPEDDANRMGKESGMDVEHQTGDAAFDSAVYIDTLTPPNVLARVLEEDARRAVRELFALGCTTVVLDDDLRNVTAQMISFPSREPPEPIGARAVDAFARLGRAMPRVAALAGEHASHPLRGTNIALGVVAAVTFFGAIPLYCGVIAGDRCANEMSPSEAATCVGPGIPGVVVGLVAAAVVGAFASHFTRRYRGRSDSSRHGATFAWLVAVIVFSVTSSLVSYVIAKR